MLSVQERNLGTPGSPLLNARFALDVGPKRLMLATRGTALKCLSYDECLNLGPINIVWLYGGADIMNQILMLRRAGLCYYTLMISGVGLHCCTLMVNGEGMHHCTLIAGGIMKRFARLDCTVGPTRESFS